MVLDRFLSLNMLCFVFSQVVFFLSEIVLDFPLTG